VLVQVGDWEHSLHDLGEVEVKHGTKLHLVNFFNEDFGNPDVPAKLQPRPATVASHASSSRSAALPVRSRKRGVMAGGILAIGVAGALIYGLGSWGGGPEVPPPLPAVPESVVAPPVEPPPPAPDPPPLPAPASPETTPSKPSASASSAPSASPARGTRGRGAALALRERTIQLNNRAAAVARLMPSFEQLPASRRGAAVRRQLAEARNRFQILMNQAGTAILAGNFEFASRTLDLAERQIELAENFLRR
jgi:hypothetical protein